MIASSGLVILLVDESAGMKAVMGDLVAGGERSTKPNSERVATAINAALKQWSAGPDFDVALVGYRVDSSENVDVGSRWGGAFAGRDFVSVREYSPLPTRVETRSRKIAAPSGFGTAREESIEFPIWYEPTLGVKAPQIAAYRYAQDLLTRWGETAGADPGAPLVIHISAGASGDGNPQMAVEKLLETKPGGVAPILLQIHLASRAELVTQAYPSTHVYLTMGSSRDLFRRASVLPDPLIAALKEAKQTVNKAARGLIYNAKIADVTRLLALVKTHVKEWPDKGAVVAAPAATRDAATLDAADLPVVASAVEQDTYAFAAEDSSSGPASDAAAGEKAGLLLLILDRSVEDPYGGNTQNACAKSQDAGNEILKLAGKKVEGALDFAIVSYGADSQGGVETRNAFDGPLAGKSIVSKEELVEGAIRVDEFEEQVSNGVGGLIPVMRKNPIYFELEPTAAAAPEGAFAAAAEIAGEWIGRHPQACLAPIVVHLTRGKASDLEIDQAVARLSAISTAAGPVVLYHLVATESPHRSLAYPATAEGIEDAGLRKLWDNSSLLLARERLAGEKPTIQPDSRGFVVNGKFDLLLEGVKDAIC